MIIREATTTDFDNVYDFICSLQGKEIDKADLMEVFATNLKNTNYFYLIAEDGKKAAGYASCHIQLLLHHAGKVAEIQEMFVLPEYRSDGIGNMLMKTIKERAKQMGAMQLEVTTRVVREKAINFYIKEQFQDTHKKLVYYF